MQTISQKCLTTACDQLRLRMIMGLIRIPIRAAQELQTWIRKTFLEILHESLLASRHSQASRVLKLMSQLCILCNDLAFLKDNLLAETAGWTSYYENLVAGGSSSMQIPGLKSDSVDFLDEAGFGPGPVQVTVTTGSSLGSGTDSDIFIDLHGIEGSEPSGKHQLKGPNAFKSGRVDTFTINLTESLHHISKIEARIG
jgi:hypothetical protein